MGITLSTSEYVWRAILRKIEEQRIVLSVTMGGTVCMSKWQSSLGATEMFSFRERDVRWGWIEVGTLSY